MRRKSLSFVLNIDIYFVSKSYIRFYLNITSVTVFHTFVFLYTFFTGWNVCIEKYFSFIVQDTQNPDEMEGVVEQTVAV